MITTKRYGSDARCILILAHGAGAPMDSSFMDTLALQLDNHGAACARFEFPYMQKRRDDGPNGRRTARLCCWTPSGGLCRTFGPR